MTPQEHSGNPSGRLVIVPLTLTEANAYVERHHRHSVPAVGHKFSVGVAIGERVVGVAIVGRPIARGLGLIADCRLGERGGS